MQAKEGRRRRRGGADSDLIGSDGSRIRGLPRMRASRPRESEFCMTEEALSFTRHEGKRWSLVQTRPRQEKFSAGNCAGQGILVYLPLITKVEIHNRSKREVQLPMFPGYFFACPSFEEETLIRREKGVWNLKVLSEPEEEGLLEDLKIVRECELLSREHQLVVKPGLQAGQTTRMRRGPFRDQEVVVVKRDGASRVVVNLEFLSRRITLNCDVDDLEF